MLAVFLLHRDTQYQMHTVSRIQGKEKVYQDNGKTNSNETLSPVNLPTATLNSCNIEHALKNIAISHYSS